MTLCFFESFVGKVVFVIHVGLSKIEKVPRGIKSEKSSKDMTSSGNLVSTIWTQTSTKRDYNWLYHFSQALYMYPSIGPHRVLALMRHSRNHEKKDLSIAILMRTVGKNKIYRIISEEKWIKLYKLDSRMDAIYTTKKIGWFYWVLGREGPYFVKEHSDAKNKYTEEDIIKMLEFLVDNIFVVFAGKVFQQIVGIPMGTNCAPLLADIFLYSYEAEFIQSLLSAGKKRLASQFNFTYRYIDDVLSINNPDFENYLGQMYPPELEIKDTTESNTSASYLDLLLSIGRDGQLRTSLYDKRDDFNFHITNFPFLGSNIPSSPAYGVFISQLIRYARACSSYECFILRAMRLSNKLLGQGYVKERLKSSLRKFYGRYGDLTKQYEVPLSRMLHDILDDDHIQWHPPLIGHYTNFWPLLIWTLWPNLTFYQIVQGFHRTYATGAACQQRTLTPPDTWSCPTLGLACVLMSRPISPELVLSPDFWISNTSRYFSFASVLSRFC